MSFPSLPGGLAEARTATWPAERLRRLRHAAQATRDALLAGGPVKACATVKLVTFPYPTLFAFSGGALSPAPFVMMTNQMQVVQFEHEGVTRTLLFNPTDYLRSKAATFYADLSVRYGRFLSEKVIPTYFGTVEEQLKRLKLTPNDVDYIAFDHLHVQDLRGWLGPDAYFPRAKLLVQKAEWETARDLHPMNRVWYVPGGLEGIATDRLIFLDGDVLLGQGVAIVSTPGHTLGNMSLVVVTPDGPFVVSENGVGSDSYAPQLSRIPGVSTWAERMGAEVLLNGNTREGSLEQYSSMVVEKILAGTAKVDPEWPAFCASSQLTTSIFAPALSPTFSYVPQDVGHLVAR